MRSLPPPTPRLVLRLCGRTRLTGKLSFASVSPAALTEEGSASRPRSSSSVREIVFTFMESYCKGYNLLCGVFTNALHNANLVVITQYKVSVLKDGNSCFVFLKQDFAT